MQNLRYTIRVNGQIVAKAEYIGIAAKICEGFNGEREIKVIDNVFSRVAFNNRGKVWVFGDIFDTIREKSEQFREDYNRKSEAA